MGESRNVFFKPAVAQVLKMRAGMFGSYRKRHSERIRMDQNGQPSIEVSLTLRLSWATQEWIGPMSELREMFFDVGKLQQWGVLHQQRAGLAAAGATAASAADAHLLAVFESMARAFWGLHSRGLCLWLGGVYSMVKLLSSVPQQRDESIARACALWDGLVVLEQTVNEGQADPELLEFWHGFLWPKSTAYKEMLVLLSEGRLEEAVAYAWRMHSCSAHEKGPPYLVCSIVNRDLHSLPTHLFSISKQHYFFSPRLFFFSKESSKQFRWARQPPCPLF